jgi:serine O-acetyltransferase
MRDSEPAGFWPAIRADFGRFREEEPGLRPLIRGLLSQGFQALLIYRVFRWFYEHGIPTHPVRFIFERFIEITTGISIPAEAAIGKGLRIHHFGGIIIHPEAVVGEECTLFHGVTIGDLGVRPGAPHIGNRVLIGAGAKVIGAICIGDDSLIGANAVVVSSVPSGYVAVGVPAVARPREKRKQFKSECPCAEPESTQELQ